MGILSTYPTISGQHALTHQPGGEDVVVGIAPGAHEATHVAGGADDIDSALDARAIALTAQGEIVYHAAAANTLATLAVGAAGQALLSGGAAANVSWGAPAPAAHEATHVQAGADDIDAALDARALGFANQGEIVFRAAAANTLGVLATGVAGQALLTGGAAADPSWGAPAPAAHVLATTGPHTNTLPLTDLEVGVQGEVIIRGVADWEALGVGAALQALLSGGAGADPYWGAPTPAAHVLATTGPHTNELPLTDLAAGVQGNIISRTVADWAALAVGGAGDALLSGGAGADVSWGAPAPAAHEGTHVSGGADDIDSTLDGRAIAFSEQGDIVYASAATTISALVHGNAGQSLLSGGHGANPSWGAPAPAAHASTHESAGSDEIRNIELNPGLADETGSGLLALVTVGENVATGDVLFLQNDGKYWKADADAAATMPGKVIVIDATIAADATGTVMHEGYYRNDDRYNWTPGAGEANLLYVHTTEGQIVQFANKPVGAGDQLQIVGYIVNADVIFFDPCLVLAEIV